MHQTSSDTFGKSPGGLNVVLASWAPFHAGAEMAAERLAMGLCRDGHRVTVVLGYDGKTAERMRALGLTVHCIPLQLTDKLRCWRYLSAQRKLIRLFCEVQPDLVHANDLPTSQMIGKAATRLKIPRLCHHRWIFTGDAADWLNKFGADRHLFVSRSIMDEMCGSTASLANVAATVVHDGLQIPPIPTESERRKNRDKLQIPDDKVVVLFAGQIIERKGVRELLEAWSQLGAKSASAALLIVGDDLEGHGRYRGEMEQCAHRLGVPAEFQGFQENVADWIVAADICIVPSHSEPFGLSVLEAMAQGRAVIGSDVGGIPEMIVDRETGLLVPPRDPSRLAAAIDELLHDSGLRQRLGQAARLRCEERFSIRAHVDAVVREYRQVVASRNRQPNCVAT